MRPALLACLIALSAVAAPARAWHDGAISDRERPLVHALQTVGVKYRLGGRSPDTGFDCSGLVVHVFERAWGMLLPPGTAALRKVGMPITKLKVDPACFFVQSWHYKKALLINLLQRTGHYQSK